MFRFLTILSAFAVALLLSGCFFGEEEYNLDLDDTGSTLDVRTGDRIVVTLPRDPRSGRSWREVSPPHTAVLARVDIRRGKTSRTGDSEQEVDAVQFFYKAVGPGFAGISLERKGPADESGVRGPTERFNVLVRAEGDRISPGNIFHDEDEDAPQTMTDSKGNVVPKPGHLLDEPVRLPPRPKNGEAPAAAK